VVEGLIARGHSSRSACRITGVNRSTFHAHRRRPASDRRIRRMIVAGEVAKIHQRSWGTYGKRRVRAALLAEHEMIVNWPDPVN
jgi:putative transposase